MKKALIFAIATVVSTQCLVGANLIPNVGNMLPGGDIFVDPQVKHFQELRDKDKAYLARLEKDKATFTRSIEDDLQEVRSQLQSISSELAQEPNDEFLNKQLQLLSERDEALENALSSRDRLISLLEQHIKIIEKFLSDPHFVAYKKDLKLSNRAVYSFDDLQRINQLSTEIKEAIAQFNNQKDAIRKELSLRQSTFAATEKSYRQKKEAFEGVGSGSFDGVNVEHHHKRSTLLKMEEQLYIDRTVSNKKRRNEIEQEEKLLNTRIALAESQLAELKELLAEVKPLVSVSDADIATATHAFEKKQREWAITKDAHTKKIAALRVESERHKKDAQRLSERFSIELDRSLGDWTRKPVKTAQGYLALLLVGNANDEVLAAKRKIELIEAGVKVEKENLGLAQIRINVKESFQKISSRVLRSEEEINENIRNYNVPKAELEGRRSRVLGYKNKAQEYLDRQKRAADHVATLRETIQQDKNTLFRGNQSDYARSLELLNNIEESIRTQIDTITKTIGLYDDRIAHIEKAEEQIRFILTELERTTFWQRPETAISWEGISKVVPDVQKFFIDLSLYIASFDVQKAVANTVSLVSSPAGMAFLAFKLLLFLLIWFAVWYALPFVHRRLLALAQQYKGLRFVCLLGAALIEFVTHSFVSLFVWIGSYVILKVLVPSQSSYPFIIFYLISIFYLTYLVSRFVRYLGVFNAQHDYAFIGREFQHRLLTVCATLLYATTTIFFFREAFITAGYYTSELPAILLAINFIIFQISLIFLISKEQILSIIPTHTEWWQQAHEKVDQYYYLILSCIIAIIVMSNPYVGFGKLVLYVLSRLVYTAILGWCLYWINYLLKLASSYIFFSTEGGVSKERFSYGKTLYGFFVIGFFLAFILSGIIVAAKIWGWPDGLANIANWADIVDWIKSPVIVIDESTKISTLSFLKIIASVFAGIGISFTINRFILARIFDVLLVDAGVQNTITSLTRYMIVMTSAIIGFQSVKLGNLIWYLLTALAVGIGWVIKDPLADFFSYFIILMQRPIKIGDYVKLDADTAGVVRKISARSVVLRQKNSTMIVVPNSSLLNRSLVNWNYTRGFIAFHDIIVTVHYEEDPLVVKKLLLNVLDENQFVLKHPKPIVRLDEFAEYGFVFMVRGFLSSNYTLDQWDIASQVRFEIVRILRENNVSLAVPTRIIIDKKGPNGLVVAADDPSRVGPKVPNKE